MPEIDFSALRKILELEQKKGYSDAAVFGGLDKFIRLWANKTIEATTAPSLLAKLQKLHLRDSKYASLTPEQREEWIKNILKFADELELGKQEKPAPIRKISVKLEKPQPQPKPAAIAAGQSLDASITAIKGISTAFAAKFSKLGVKTIRDLLYFFPSRHVDYSRMKTVSQLQEGQEETIVANVWEAKITMPRGRRSTEAIVGDETGNVRAMWFNNPWLAKTLQPNMKIVLSGKVRLFNGRFVFESPEWEPLEEGDLIHTGRLVPVYPLTEGLHQRQTRKMLKGIVDLWAGPRS